MIPLSSAVTACPLLGACGIPVGYSGPFCFCSDLVVAPLAGILPSPPALPFSLAFGFLGREMVFCVDDLRSFYDMIRLCGKSASALLT